jgi:hypothetical protein
MLRCVTLATVWATCAFAQPALAQVPRTFPANALRGEIVITQPPELLLNQQPARLAPGGRIRAANNMLALSGTLVGQRLLVHYTVDASGGIFEVWVLTPAEAERRPWPTTPAQAAAWRFNPDTQTWSPP